MDKLRQVINNRYEILSTAGLGGFGIVYRVFDILDGSEKALKYAHQDYDSSQVTEQAFKREFRSMAALSHPNLLRVFDFGADSNGRVFFTMEFVNGFTLDELQWDPHSNLLYYVIKEILLGLDALHSRDIVHSDLKPQNIMLFGDDPAWLKGCASSSSNGSVDPTVGIKLLDYGLLKNFGAPGQEGVFGTLEYTGPEVLLGKAVDHRSDLYSLGVTLYEILTGELPFQATESFQLIQKQIEESAVPPVRVNPRIPESLGKVIEKLLEKDPRRRFQYTSDIREIIASIQGLEEDERDREDFTRHLLGSQWVGRAHLLENLRILADASGRMGELKLAAVHGERGAGKSRFSKEAKTLFQLQDLMVASASCCETGDYVPYRPVVELLRVMVAESGRDLCSLPGEYGDEIKDFIPELSRAGEGSGLDRGEEVERWAEFRLFESVLTVFRDLCEDKSVLIVDDIHLADEITMKLMGYLVRGLKHRPVLVIFTYRSSFERELVDRLVGSTPDSGVVEEIELGPLDPGQSASMVNSMLGTENNTEAFLKAIHRSAGGNPALLEQKTRQLISSGKLYRHKGKWISEVQGLEDDLASLPEVDDPDQLLWNKLNALPAELLDIYRACAAAKSFDALLISEVLARPSHEMPGCLGSLCERGVIREVELEGEAVFCISNASQASMALEKMAFDSRADLMKRVALTLENSRGSGAEVSPLKLAELFIAGGSPDKAIEYTKIAGSQLEAAYDNGKAIWLYSSLRALLEAPECRSSDRREFSAKLGGLYLRAGKREEALVHFEAGLDASSKVGEKAMILRSFAEIYHRLGRSEAADRYLGDALSAAGEIESASERAEAKAVVYLLKGLVSADRKDLAGALSFVNSGLEALGRRRNLWAVKIKLYNSKIRFLYQSGLVTEAAELIRRTVKMAERRSRFRSLSSCMCMLGVIAYGKEDFHGSLHSTEKALLYAEASGDAIFIERAHSNLGWINHRLGNWEQAYEHYRKGILLAEKIEDVASIATLYNNLSLIAQDMGDFDNAFKFLDKAGVVARMAGLSDVELSINGNLGDLNLEAGNIEEAERILRASLHQARSSENPQEEMENLTRLAELCARKGSAQEAVALVESGLAVAEKLGDTQESAKLRRAFALAKCHEGERQGVAEILEQSRSVFLEGGQDFERAKTSLVLGRHYSDVGKKRLARRALIEAEEIFNQLGALQHLSRVRELLQVFKTRKEDKSGHIKRMQMLLDSSRALVAILDRETLLTVIIDMSLELAGAERGFLLRPEEGEGAGMRFLVSRDREKNDLPGEDFPISQSVVESVIHSRRPLTIRDIELSTRFKTRESILSLELKSIMCAPLFSRDELLGVIYVDNNLSTAESFTSDDERLIEALASHAIVAIENAKLHGDLLRSYQELVQSKVELEESCRNLEETQENLIQAEKMSAFGQLAAGIAHELRQPLTAIQLYSEMTMRSSKEKKTQEYVGDLAREAKRMTDLVGRINKYTRKSSSAEFTEVDLQEAIDYALALVKKELTLPYVRVNKNFVDEKLMLRGEVAQLEQVFANLLKNACDAMIPGKQGELWIDTQRYSDETCAAVMLKDNGQGMSAEVKEKVFSPFFTTKESGKGTGLGLSIVMGVVNNHSGTVEMESEVGEGTAFILRFPRVPPESAPE